MKPEIWLILVGSPKSLNFPKLFLFSPSNIFTCPSFSLQMRAKPWRVLVTFTTQTVASYHHRWVHLAGVVNLPATLQPCQKLSILVFQSIFSQTIVGWRGRGVWPPQEKGGKEGKGESFESGMKKQFSIVMQSHSKIPQKGRALSAFQFSLRKFLLTF